VKIGVRNLIRNLLTDRAEVSAGASVSRSGIYANTPDWARSFSYPIDLSDGVVLQEDGRISTGTSTAMAKRIF
jgi:hypothetical protein